MQMDAQINQKTKDIKSEIDNARHHDFKWFLSKLKPYYLEDIEFNKQGQI